MKEEQYNWDEICDNMSLASQFFEKSKQDDLVEMLSADFEDMENDKSLTLKDKLIYSRRILARSKSEPTEITINRVWEDSLGDEYIVGNYDYKMYRWAATKGFGKNVDNLCIHVYKKGLSDRERKSFEGRIKQNSK